MPSPFPCQHAVRRCWHPGWSKCSRSPSPNRFASSSQAGSRSAGIFGAVSTSADGVTTTAEEPGCRGEASWLPHRHPLPRILYPRRGLLARGVIINVGPYFTDDDLACIVHGVHKVGRHYLPLPDVLTPKTVGFSRLMLMSPAFPTPGHGAPPISASPPPPQTPFAPPLPRQNST